MNTITYFNNFIFRVFRKFFNTTRWTLIKTTRLLSERTKRHDLNAKIALINLQYVNAFSEIDMLCGVALTKRGYDVKAIVCPGLDYCEREDHQIKRPRCEECIKESSNLCASYGFEILKPRKNFKDVKKTVAFKKLKTPLNELVYRNYVHFKKSFSEIDYDTWKRIERSAIKLCDYVSELECDFSKVEKVITANGRFFQTAIPLELIKTKTGFVTTEVFNDHKIVFGRNTFSLNNELEVNEEELLQLQYDRKHPEDFINSEGRTNDGGIQVWGKVRIEDTEVLRKTLKTEQYNKILAFFPNVIWDSTWFGLGHFCHSPASFLPILNKFAKKFPDILFVIRAHPGEKNVPRLMKASASIFSDLSCQHINFEPNIVFINSANAFSSYKIADIADYIIVWNGTLGLEFTARGKGVLSIADSYYEKFGIVQKINNINDLEKILTSKRKFTPTERDLDIANRILYATRNSKRIKSPIHKSTFCTKFLWNAGSRREQNFNHFFPDYFEEKISIYELNEALEN